MKLHLTAPGVDAIVQLNANFPPPVIDMEIAGCEFEFVLDGSDQNGLPLYEGMAAK